MSQTVDPALLLLLPSQSGGAICTFHSDLICSLLGEALAGLNVCVQWLPHDVHFIQTLAESIIGVIVQQII